MTRGRVRVWRTVCGEIERGPFCFAVTRRKLRAKEYDSSSSRHHQSTNKRLRRHGLPPVSISGGD